MSAFKEVADIRTADTLDLKKPKAIVQEVVAKPSRIQRREIKSLSERAAAIRSGEVDPRDDNMLKITTDGRKIGLDQRLINPDYPDDPKSKVNLCVNKVFDIYKETADKRSTQLIFCDMSTPKVESRQDVFTVFRKNAESMSGYDIVRKKVGFENIKKKGSIGFSEIKDYVNKAAKDNEDDKLKNGDIIVIRRPSEDMKNILSEAAEFVDGQFVKSPDLLDKFSISAVENMPPKEFNVYDDIKSKLIAMGVPEKEIAFIHDYDTSEDKQKLFDKMNVGDVRILLGSTAKCGAGMNAQTKMIALHHLDAPLRPSDMQQRSGRIERQGNENKEVQIYRYVTDRTFDSYIYQMLENKQRFISQIMTSKTPERTCSDIDEQALDYAEVKALCAGNPLILEQMQLQNTINDLKMQKSSFNENLYRLQDNISIKFPADIKTSELLIKHYSQDHNTAVNAPKAKNEEGKEVYPLTMRGRTYIERSQSGDAVKDALLKNITLLGEGKTVNIGEYRGLKLSVFIDPLKHTYKACLTGEKNYYLDLNMDAASHNIMIRLDNCIDNIKSMIDEEQKNCENLKNDLEAMKKDANKTFPKAAELEKAEMRLAEVLEMLADQEITDDSAQKDIYERFEEMFPDIMSGKCEYIRMEAGEAFEPLHISMYGNEFSISHSYEQYGDLMYDPRVDFIVDRENEKVIPLSFTNSGTGTYEEYDIGETPTRETAKSLDSLMNFMDMWLDNIGNQGYREVKRREPEPELPPQEQSKKADHNI